MTSYGTTVWMIRGSKPCRVNSGTSENYKSGGFYMNRPSKPEKQVIDLQKSRNPKDFLEALTTTRAGDEIIYWRGEYAGGQHKTAVMQEYEDGLVAPLRRKLGPKVFEYIAQRTRKKRK